MPPEVNDSGRTLTPAQAAELIGATAGHLVILTHVKPDGDAFGSVIAMTAALRALERSVTACFVPPVPASLLDLRGSDLAVLFREEIKLPEAALYLVFDTGAWSQLGPLRRVLEPSLDRTLIIDHHLSGDVPARHRCVDPGAAASCELVASIIERLFDGPLFDRVPGPSGEPQANRSWLRIIHEALFVGIASDTGWFRFSNTRPETHELASRLLRQGIDQGAIYRQLEQAERPEKLALLIRALVSLKLIAEGRAAIMVLRRDDFADTGALEEETDRLIDIPQQVASIRVIVLLSERSGDFSPAKGRTDNDIQSRLSFRSKPGPRSVNVAELARHFGGGGHARAAGATVAGCAEAVLPRLTQVLLDAVGSA